MEKSIRDLSYIHPGVRIGKWCFDKFFGLLGVSMFLSVLPILAIAIKLDSKGPIFYRQMRVGRAHSRYTEIFWVIKLRSMVVDAEVKSGAQWAKEDDPRVTRVGKFLRKTRIDELPQFINVLLGEMSIIGPRPERPVFFQELENQIPFYVERVIGIAPGITGLAQVYLGYDEDIESVRKKLAYDHAYALILTRPWKWFLSDMSILLMTIKVVILGRGR